MQALGLLTTNLRKKLFAVEMWAQHLKHRKAIDNFVIRVNEKYLCSHIVCYLLLFISVLKHFPADFFFILPESYNGVLDEQEPYWFTRLVPQRKYIRGAVNGLCKNALLSTDLS